MVIRGGFGLTFDSGVGSLFEIDKRRDGLMASAPREEQSGKSVNQGSFGSPPSVLYGNGTSSSTCKPGTHLDLRARKHPEMHCRQV
jgi:hypothetical protein